MVYTTAHIAQIIGAEARRPLDNRQPIKHLLIDSRNPVFLPEALFFALPGHRHDGHDYLVELYEAGLRQFVIAREFPENFLPEAQLLKVPNTLLALQTLACHHRTQFNIPIIGITGSNGKTIVKEWLFQLLQADFAVVRSPKSYNSQIGVPLSIWLMEQRHELGIFEAGISQRAEMEKLAPIIDCSIGVLTNIGDAHQEGFSSKKEKLEEKLFLFAGASSLIYRCDDPLIRENLALSPNQKHFRWSTQGHPAELQIVEQRQSGKGTLLRAHYQGQKQQIRLPFTDEASIENAIHCWALMLHLGYPIQVIRPRLAQLEAVGMRLELKPGINGCVLVNDSYNSDLKALHIALNFLEQQSPRQKRHLFLSDILQSGRMPAELYREVAQLLVAKKIHKLTGIGTNIPLIKTFLPAGIKSSFYSDTEQFLAQVRNEDFRDEAILIKGARAFAFERIANRLAQQVHQTVLEINLSAMLHNLKVYSSYLQPSTKLMVMVKASAYGSGSYEVARLLEYQQVDYLVVAYSDEGVALRQAGIRTPIMVLNPDPNHLDTLIRYQLEPEIYSFALLDQLQRLIPRRTKTPFPIHLKIETGMYRLGFAADEIVSLGQYLKQMPQLKVQSIFSHLSASDNPSHDDFTHQQASIFQDLYAVLSRQLGYQPWRHLLNTGGINRFPQYQMDMVRLGIGLYGIDGSATIQDRLQTVLTLKARISQINELPAGASVGYQRGGQADHDRRIATISVGYADGLLRAAGNERYQVLIAGQKVPIIGNVCMDMCMIDISKVPDVAVGDEVIIFGSEPPVQDLADCLGTIPYEVFTNISERVKRVYYQE